MKKEIVKQREIKSGHVPQKGPDTMTNWPTDFRSQYNLNLMWVCLIRGCPQKHITIFMVHDAT
jgi:hypothetical protein